MKKISDWIQEFTGFDPVVQHQILTSLIVIFILWLIRTVVIRIVMRRTDDPYFRYRWRKSITYICVVIGLLIVGRIWFVGVDSVATYLGLLSAGLAIALQSLVKSIAGWVFVMLRKPFAVGDRIQVGTYAGDVIDIRLFKFS